MSGEVDSRCSVDVVEFTGDEEERGNGVGSDEAIDVDVIEVAG